jgi:shikimate dehydrogenase
MLPNGKTRLLAIFGNDLSYSKSPSLHNEWAQSEGLNLNYLPIEVKDENHFNELVFALTRSPSFLGANITNPYKASVVKCSGNLNFRCDERVQNIGAANTLFTSNKDWYLTNTDVDGIWESLNCLSIPTIDTRPNTQKIALIAGAGGAAAAAAYAVKAKFPEYAIVTICRSKNRVHDFLKSSSSSILEVGDSTNLDPLTQLLIAKTCLLINTLPLGQKQEQNPICQTILSWAASNKEQAQTFYYFDMTYGGPPAVDLALSHKIKAIDGSIMLEAQALKSFSIWKDSLKPDQ